MPKVPRSILRPTPTGYPNVLKAVGESKHQAMANHNSSIYQAFYAASGRRGSTASTPALIIHKNSKTRRPPPFASRATRTRARCSQATPRVASNGAPLMQAFEAIVREFAKLQIAS
jgi:hypothetical protein